MLINDFAIATERGAYGASLYKGKGDKISADKKKSEKLDFSDRLVGNVKQEHTIEDHIWQEGKPSMFHWVGGCASLYVQSLL